MTLDVSFSDRFSNVAKLTDSLHERDAQDRDDAQKRAREIENDFYAGASSVDDYNTKLSAYLSGSAIDDNDDTVPPAAEDVKEADQDLHPALSPTAITLGRYTGCQHYRDGISSTVYRARNPDADPDTADPTKAYVALKLTTPSALTPPHNSEREARILSALTHAPHIIPLLTTFRLPGGHLVLAFPFMPLDLATALATSRLSRASARAHAHDMLHGLAALHAAGILHRDLKPSNVLLASPAGPARLADLGTAWAPADPASEPATRKITDIGTTAYRPPEILFGSTDYGAPLDLWAAGCVVAEAAGLRRAPLFEAGPLGSELALIRSIFETLGTPDARSWPEAASLPDWGKFAWREYEAQPWERVLPGASEAARDLVATLVRYESRERLGAEQALRHPYFAGLRDRVAG